MDALKLSGRAAAEYVERLNLGHSGVLLYGGDAMRVALRRETLIAGLIGPDGPAEMRLTRMAGAAVRRDPASLLDAVKAVGFFAGPRVVLVEEATDVLGPAIRSALADWRAGDAQIVVTASGLGPGSALRKLFEGARTAAAIAIYADPPAPGEIARDLAQAGLDRTMPQAMEAIEALGRSVDPGDFAQFVTKLALFKLGSAEPVSLDDVGACAPLDPEGDVDSLLNLAADGMADRLPSAIRKLGRSRNPTTIVIAAGRHFRTLHAAACAKDNADAALAQARPPVFGPRRTRMAAQARAFGPARLERALGWIMDTDLALRSSRPGPALALVERLLMRISMLRE